MKDNNIRLRHEYKCRINLHDIIPLRQRLKQIMHLDPNAGSNGIYTIKSLYFDNYFDKALAEKSIGVMPREKFRIRYYNDDTSFIRLEKKSKINGLCNKQSCAITAQECTDIINGSIKSVFETEEELKRELYSKMCYQLLRPKNIVTYEREAYVYEPGNVRVTFDTGIRGSRDTGSFLSSDASFIHLYNNAILEIKWDDYLPQVIKDILQTNTRSVSNFSKYAATRFF